MAPPEEPPVRNFETIESLLRDDKAQEVIQILNDDASLIHSVCSRLRLNLMTLALYYKNDELINFLFEHMLRDVMSSNPIKTYTVITYAIDYVEDKDLFRRIIQKFNNVNFEHYLTKMTALHYAVQNMKAKFAKILLEHGADKTIKNMIGQTPIDMAHQIRNPDIKLKMLSLLNS